ncbi:MAG: alpha/beta fold hydrolase [Acidimicrobiales bacterium]|nr:alpha/beta fold hydrolase [Acidimicrobiales bacterium]
MTDHPDEVPENDAGAGAASRPTRLATADAVVLEAAWSGPIEPRAVAVLTHPHPAYGGDMHNLVPASLARSLPEHDIATLRVNFRGVASSTGAHGDGRAEIADIEAALDAAAADGGAPVVGIGYSYGADVLLATGHAALRAVVAVAPPLAVLPADELAAHRGAAPTLVLSAEHDQFRPPDDAAAIAGTWPATTLGAIEGADHFLAGAADRVVERTVTFLDQVLDSPGPRRERNG